MRKIREVRKRDNRIVPFDKSKIADAIYAAFRSVGEGDRPLAQELSAAVTHFLEEKYTGTIPGIEDIQDVVETVLIEMGHSRAAKAYILYRQKRATMREMLQVRRASALEGPGAEETEEWTGQVPPDVHQFPEVDLGDDGVSTWQKSRIAAALVREADLDPSVAAEIASNVERKVLGSGMQRISTSLIRELVDNELFERGFSAKLQKQAPISLPKYNLEQIIFGTDVKEGFTFPKTPLEIRNIIADRILHQYSLQEVFTPSVANAHNDGRVFVHRLSDPVRLARLHWRLPPPGIPLGHLGAGRHASGADFPVGDPASGDSIASPAWSDLGDLFRKLWQLAHFFSEEIRLSGLGSALQDPSCRGLPASESARAFLERLSQMEERPDIALELELGPAALPWLEALADISRVRRRRFLVALRLDGELFRRSEADIVLRRVADLYGRGERIELLPPFRPGPAGAGGSGAGNPGRRGAELGSFSAVASKITINLPRAALRSGRDRRSSMETEVHAVLDLAVKGHLERRRFIERLGSSREGPLWDLLGKGGPVLVPADIAFGIGVVGLNECVKYLTGNELHQDPAAGAFALDLIRGIERKLRREERSLGVRLVLEETANVGPVRVLERTDRRRHPQVAEIDRGRNPQWGAAYSNGVRFHRMAPLDPYRRVEELAPYLRIVELAGGFVEEFPELRSSAGDLLPSLLEECALLLAERPPAVVAAEARKGREEKG